MAGDEGARARGVTVTRSAVLRSARAALSDPNPRQWTMKEVAAAASVTRVTVYNQFGSRTALIEAVLDEVVARDHMDRLVAETDNLAPSAALEAIIATTCRFWHAERALLRGLFAAAYEDAAIAELLHRREGWRRDQFRAVLARVGGSLQESTEESHTADLLTAVTSFTTYDQFGGAAEDPDRAAALLTRLTRCLLTANGRRSPRGRSPRG
ncbi:MAG: TetR/AcrR family transcriptional regulator [Actinomycetota bacterium]|nr:TetR/AcrR family transcriptional regulator [Actinomycetota bacterium]